ncbi:hypothetical protein J2Z40_000408 [Cytobacillus eiseniae]|uniref:Uncharacterized protein n=1 Tax=Cytobacillus eiseniae TaxID=762947 RepID=A0ABS4RAE2_9BACI|nr:hypothetical protein [Cytobacillus eiseniae]MBP2239855.1 hypothetical protein [Cytobacillus eiseniae]
MNYEREKANMLAENLKSFTDYVLKSHKAYNIYLSNQEKLYRLSLLTDEFEIQILADELLRINRFIYDEKTTAILVERIRKALTIIGDYIDNNFNDLFIFTPRLHILRMLSSSFTYI